MQTATLEQLLTHLNDLARQPLVPPASIAQDLPVPNQPAHPVVNQGELEAPREVNRLEN